jgi:tetratricopeptide (TPR) repeat protein
VASYVFFPSGVDLFSTIIWGTVAAAIGGMIVEAVRASITGSKAGSRSVLVLVIGTVIWLSYYNLPVYCYLLRGGLERDCSQAIHFWFKAYELQPKLGLTYLRIGECYYALEDYDRAIQWLDAGKVFEPRGEILTVLGFSHFEKGDIESAVLTFREALQMGADGFATHFGLGVALHRQVDYEGSLEELSKAVEIDQDSPIARFWLGWSLFENGYYEAAQPQFQYAIEKDFQVARAHAGIGFCSWRLDRRDLALQEFAIALSLDPDQEDVRIALEAIQ